jgi:hypothetical protein
MPDINSEEVLNLALSALENPSTKSAEDNFRTIILTFEGRHGGSQKEVAEELQRVSKQLEALGNSEKAMEFKQRTTEIMLRLGMERRRAMREAQVDKNQGTSAGAGPGASQGASPAASAGDNAKTETPRQIPQPYYPGPGATLTRMPAQKPKPRASEGPKLTAKRSELFQSIVYMLHTSSHFGGDRKLYTDVMEGREIWSHLSSGKRSLAIDLGHDPVILLVESDTLPRLLPIFSVRNLKEAQERLERQGMSLRDAVSTPAGTALVFKGSEGISVAIVEVANNG